MQKKEWILWGLMICQLSLLGQVEWSNHLGGRIGATVQLGKPVNRVGVVANIFFQYDFVELDVEWRGHYNFSNFGPPTKGWESQITTGLTFTFGKKDSLSSMFAFPFVQHTQRKYALGYAFHFYKDQIETSQRSGTIALQFDHFYVIFQNDALGSFRGNDEFRTGAFSIFYERDQWLYELKTVLWTGSTGGEGTQTFRDTDYPCRFGYRDISGAKYGRYSHGILAGQIHRVLDYGQTVQFGLGIDSEQIRNFIQNKLIHDMYFFPRSWIKTQNLHIPMLDENGNAYTYQYGQKIKPSSWYFNLGWNGESHY